MTQLANVIFIYLPTSYPRYAASLFAANGESSHANTFSLR